MSPIRPLLALLPLALLLQGCALDLFGPSDEWEDELRAARARWERQGIADYRYTVRRTCFCPPEVVGPARVEVRGGKTVSVTPLETESGRQFRPEVFTALDSVEDLFATVQAAIDEDPDALTAGYDPARGHPLRLFVDYEENAADEENGFEVSDFEPVF